MASPLEEFVLPKRNERIKKVAESRTEQLTIVLDDINNSHNISAVVRSADAFGVQYVHRIRGCKDYSRGISLGAERWVNVIHYQSETDALEKLQSEGFELVVLQSEELNIKDPSAKKVVPVHELPFERRLALVFGNEKNGVSTSLREAATHFAYIPMLGFVESLNISVAAAITLHCSLLSDAKSIRRPKAISPEKQEALRNEWLKQDVRGAELILKRIETSD